MFGIVSGRIQNIARVDGDAAGECLDNIKSDFQGKICYNYEVRKINIRRKKDGMKKLKKGSVAAFQSGRSGWKADKT